jgi:hypothetical protein
VYVILPGKTRSFDYVLLVISAAYIGGASESFALIFLAILVGVLTYQIFFLKKRFSEVTSIKLLIGISILAYSFAFSYLAPGTEIRHSLLPHTTPGEKFIIGIKAVVKYFIRYLPEKLPYILLLSAPWLAVGHTYFGNKFSREVTIRIIRKTTVLFLLLLIIMFIPTVFIMSESGPDRALSVISLLTIIYFPFLFVMAGSLIDFEKTRTLRLMLIANYAVCFLLIYHLISQYSIVTKFSAAYADRMEIIESARNQNFKGILNLSPLPSSGLLYWDELSADTAFFTNKHLVSGLDLPFSVRLKSE